MLVLLSERHYPAEQHGNLMDYYLHFKCRQDYWNKRHNSSFKCITVRMSDSRRYRSNSSSDAASHLDTPWRQRCIRQVSHTQDVRWHRICHPVTLNAHHHQQDHGGGRGEQQRALKRMGNALIIIQAAQQQILSIKTVPASPQNMHICSTGVTQTLLAENVLMCGGILSLSATSVYRWSALGSQTTQE